MIWLSNQPPESMEKEVKASGMHRYSSLKKAKNFYKNKNQRTSGKNHSGEYSSGKTKSKAQSASYKRPSTIYLHWIRQGNSVENAPYICLPDSAAYQLVMMSPSKKKVPVEMVNNKPCYIKFGLGEEGYYNAYLIVKQGEGDTLHINIAKAELLSHSCRNGHHKKLEARPVEFYPEITEFEIIRKRHPHESYHYFASSGDEETFSVLYQGKPLANVNMRLNTQKGWAKTGKTDKNGNFKVQFIQDYFSPWQELDKRKIHYYMVNADYTIPKDTLYKGKKYKYIHYNISMSDGYRPSRTMYTSMLWALVVFLVTMVISIIGVYIYKERRKQPYKEITFNEKD